MGKITFPHHLPRYASIARHLRWKGIPHTPLTKDRLTTICIHFEFYSRENDYIYIYPASNNKALTLGAIVIESAFEHPNQIILENGDANELDVALDDNEWILSEDMVGQIKEIIYKRDLLNQVRQTDEVPNNIKF